MEYTIPLHFLLLLAAGAYYMHSLGDVTTPLVIVLYMVLDYLVDTELKRERGMFELQDAVILAVVVYGAYKKMNVWYVLLYGVVALSLLKFFTV